VEEKKKLEELPPHFLIEALRLVNKIVIHHDKYTDAEFQDRINLLLNKSLESKSFNIKKEALEVIESLIYKYDVEFLDYIDKSK